MRGRSLTPPSTTLIPELLLVGCGRMGTALLDGWIRDGLAPSWVVDPASGDIPPPHRSVASLGDLPRGLRPAAVVLAVKPQVAGEVLPSLGAAFPDALLLSIMAGRTLASLQLGTGLNRIVRAMPNTPAAIGRGISGLFAAATVGDADRALAERLLRAVGEVVWLSDEGQLDVVTAVSGSGPAYVFLLAELLERAGARAGLPADVARRLARATVSGAGALLAATDADAREMREAVTSKAGTTERALAVLMAENAMPALIDRAVDEAALRSRELAS